MGSRPGESVVVISVGENGHCYRINTEISPVTADTSPYRIRISLVQHLLFRSISRTGPRVSNANQSPVPIGNSPIELHLYSPNASVSMLARTYTIFWTKRVLNDLEEDDDGANGANAVY